MGQKRHKKLNKPSNEAYKFENHIKMQSHCS